MRQAGAEILGLSSSEHLLVWSLRQLIARRGACRWIAGEFTEACGDDATEVLATFQALIHMLAYAGRRPLRVGWPGRSDVTADERQLLSVIAAAQAGDRARLEAHLRWLAHADVRHELAIAIRAFATALATHRLLLPLSALPLGRNLGRGLHLAASSVVAKTPVERAR